jgi:hypothetical protein
LGAASEDIGLDAAELLGVRLDATKVAGVAPAAGAPVEISGSVVRALEGPAALAELATADAATAGAGLEATLAEAAAGLVAGDEAPPAAGGPVEIIAAVVRVLADDGTVWRVDAEPIGAIFGIAPTPGIAFGNEPAPQRH